MKIRIIGPCGSGKSYISKKLSKKYGIPYYELDHLVWNQEKVETRSSIGDRDFMLKELVSRDSWIIEGTHISWTRNTLEEADVIFLLMPHPLLNDLRIIKNLGASPEVSVFGEVAAKPRRVQSLHPRSKQRSILARRIKRFILSRLRLEKGNYKQSFSNLIKMIVEWNHGFNSSRKIIDTEEYASKRLLIRSGKEILKKLNMQNQLESLILKRDIGKI